MKPSNLHIGFMNTGGSDWLAGTSYLLNLFKAIRSLPIDEQPKICLLVSPLDIVDDSLRIYVDEVLVIPKEASQSYFWNALLQRLPGVLSKSLRSFFVRRSHIGKYLKKQGVKVLFSQPGKLRLQYRFDVALLIWIPDFQHLHLGEMFSQREIIRRNNELIETGACADRVILSSQDALADSCKYFPSIYKKARVLPFVSNLPEDVYQQEPLRICRHYNLPDRFIYLPNQFWKHKNHLTVIDALNLASKQDSRITIVCTGSMLDYRDVKYLPNLFTRLSEYNLRERFIILGVIPYNHVFQLMRQSLAVLQPSMFEGWSTTVEEAKSLGKEIIISDIPIHREQNPPAAHYFDPQNPVALSAEMLSIFTKNDPGPDLKLEASARQILNQSVKQFGDTFIKIIHEVV